MTRITCYPGAERKRRESNNFSSPSATKAKFDTLISRVRKTMAEDLPENTARCQITWDKGIIWLAHCRVDALDSLDAVNRSLEHSRLQEFWQAGNTFTRAEDYPEDEVAELIEGHFLLYYS